MLTNFARWTYLVGALDKVMNDLEHGMDMNLYMGVYTYVYLYKFYLLSKLITDVFQRCT